MSQNTQASCLRFKRDSKTHIEALRFPADVGIKNENSLTFVTKRLMPIEDKWLVENAGGHISEIIKFGHFIWYHKIKISKESLQFMAYATQTLL